ncbi:MAG: alpha/beta fold hydrolase [Telluria sp.]
MKASLLFALAIALAAGAPALAADPAAATARAAGSVAAERFEVGTLLVERHGKQGRPLILIPGLGSGAWAWRDTVREYSGNYTVYVLTLPGFDGRPAVAGAGFAAARDAVQQLITTRKLDKPVLIGHSMGGALALAVAAQLPDQVGGVIAVDGLPVMPGTEAMTSEQRPMMAQRVQAQFTGLTPVTFAAQQQMYMRNIGVLDTAMADELAVLAARSDPAAVSAYMGEVLSLDLRPSLPAIKAPVLVLAPWNAADARGLSAPAKAAYYKSLMAGTARVEVVPVEGARHFVMFDQPRQVSDNIGRFLKSL